MKALSGTGVRRWIAVLLAGGLLATAVTACGGGQEVRAQAHHAYTLPPARTPGDWKPPRDPAERQRLNAIVRQHFTSFQECTWRYAGMELSRTTPQTGTTPIVATLGIDVMGRVVWLELNARDSQRFALRECLSRQLVDLVFDPPPAEPVLLVFALPQFRGR